MKFSADAADCGAKYDCPQGRIMQEEDLPLYRGQPDDWPVLPSIARAGLDLNYEKSLISTYMSAWEKAKGQNINLFETLALMQHSRVLYTRLLDWTTNVDIALYFAIENAPLNPILWKYVSEGHHRVGGKTTKEGGAYHTMRCHILKRCCQYN